MLKKITEYYNRIELPKVRAKVSEYKEENLEFGRECRLRYIKQQITELNDDIDDTLELISEVEDEWLRDLLTDYHGIEGKLKRLKSFQYELEHKDSSKITEEDILAARQVDIISLDLIPNTRSIGNGRYACPCIFHEETQPSMVIYGKGKGGFCFGCNRLFSSIDIVMHYHNYSFIEAVKYLINK